MSSPSSLKIEISGSGKSFTLITNNRVAKIDLWATPAVMIAQEEV